MYSKVKLLGHPLHPMLIAFPVAFYTATFIAYVVYALGGSLFAFQLGVVANIAGVVMAVVAAVPGFIDWFFGIPRATMAKTVGLRHLLLNVTALILFLITAIVNGAQWTSTVPDVTLGWILSLIGVGLTVAAGFFGWSLIQDHKVGVNLTPEQARLQAAMEAGTSPTTPATPRVAA